MSDILYVEDDDEVRGLYAECLRDAGFSVREARLAEEGLHAVRRARPGLVLLDLAMPPGEMSGTELLARLREEPASALIPTIVFSAIGKILNPEFIKSLRVAAVVAKPAHAHHLVKVIAEVMGADALSGSCAPSPGTS